MRSAAALSIGLAVAMSLASGCLEPGPGDSDDDGTVVMDDDGLGNSVVASYGTAPSVGTGYDGFGGNDGTGGSDDWGEISSGEGGAGQGGSGQGGAGGSGEGGSGQGGGMDGAA